MKKLFASSLILMAITGSSVFAQQKTTAGSAESASSTGEKRSAPAQAISDRDSKGSTSTAGSSGHPSTTGASSTSSGSPNVKLPSTQNSTKTGQQSSAPAPAVNGNARKP